MSTIATESCIVEAVRIVSLPCELQNAYDVNEFVTNVLRLGSVSSVNIVPMQTESGVRYRSAFVDIKEWSSSSAEIQQKLLSAGQSGFNFSGEDMGIHFDNGKPMSHLKIVAAKSHSPSTSKLELEDGAWTSVYIPVLPDDLEMDYGDMRYNDEAKLAELFEDQLKIGEVSRVDFMSKPIPGTDRKTRCAYVHFNCWYDNHTARLIRKTITDKGEFSCNGYYDGFEFRRFEHRRFINFKINHKPIPAVTEDMNIHQLVARIKFLEEQNAQLEEQNASLQKEVAEFNSMAKTEVPGMGTQLDFGPILEENARLKRELGIL